MKLILLCVLVASAQVYAQFLSCMPSCTPSSTSPACQIPNTVCRNIYENSGVDRTDYRCVCLKEYSASCDNAGALNCTNGTVPDNSCGREWPAGCPEGSYCWTSTDLQSQRCVCKDPQLSFTAQGCLPVCWPYSYLNQDTKTCKCEEGFIPDPRVAPTPPYVRCIPGPNTTLPTCDNFVCPTGLKCIVDSAGKVQCVRDTTVPTCGIDFRCPSDRYDCIDAPTGPICRCKPGTAGPDCMYVPCWYLDNSDNLGCYFPNGHAVCEKDNISPVPYCKCEDGWTGRTCEIQDNACDNVTCSGANKRCIKGVCVCIEGFIPAPRTTDNRDWTSYDCVPANPPTCENVTCSGNTICVIDASQKPVCVCPYNTYGGSECNKPRCLTDRDCSYLANAFCVINTADRIPPYCSCKRGYTGAYCNETVTCPTCPENYQCNNEGRCKCAPGYTGDKCEIHVPTDLCVSSTVYIRFPDGQPLSAEEIKEKLADLVKVDVTNLIIEGPFPTQFPNIVLYRYSFCSDQDVDSTRTDEDFNSLVASGDTGGLEIVTDPSTSSSTGSNNESSTAVTTVVSVALMIVALAMTL